MARKPIEISTGDKYGMLTILGFECSYGIPKRRYWKCICDCGKSTVAHTSGLVFGGNRSCGCNKRGIAGYKHGLSDHRLYRTWHQMKARCFVATLDAYKYYGARGITVCKEWQDSFKPFHDWAMANGWRKELTLDRIDNDGNYEPSNCRWATKMEQMSNTRGNRWFTVNGEKLTLSQVSRLNNIPVTTIITRIKRGWDKEKAITTPVKKKY